MSQNVFLGSSTVATDKLFQRNSLPRKEFMPQKQLTDAAQPVAAVLRSSSAPLVRQSSVDQIRWDTSASREARLASALAELDSNTIDSPKGFEIRELLIWLKSVSLQVEARERQACFAYQLAYQRQTPNAA